MIGPHKKLLVSRLILIPLIAAAWVLTDINREGFQKMLTDIASRKINQMILKDLSRLFQNYTDAESLIENLFLKLNVRFINPANVSTNTLPLCWPVPR